MRRVLVPNLSATFHAPRTKFVHDLKVNQPNSQPNSNKNDRSRKKPTSFWTPHCQLCFRIMRYTKEFSDVTLPCEDGQLLEAHKVMMMIFQCISVLRFHKSQRNVSTTKWPNHDRSKEWRQMEKLKIKITRISELGK